MTDTCVSLTNGTLSPDQRVNYAYGMVLGTAHYMSPEQARGMELDARTDVWSLGCVLYELASGDAPFKGPTPQATLMRRFTGPPRPLRPVINVPEAVEAAIMRSVARDPNERFATAAEFRAALTDVPHKSLWVVYPVMIGFTAVFLWRGITGFTKRVIA